MPVPNLTRSDAQRRAALLEVAGYQVDLDLTDGAGSAGERTFRSRTTVRFHARTPGASTFIDLVAEGVRTATLNGRRLGLSDYRPESGIALPELAADNELIVDADCLYTNTGEGLHRFTDPVDGEVYLYSQFETADAKRVFACFDQPDLKAEFAFTVRAPESWEVVSNAALQSRPDAQTRVFATTKRLPTYVTALVAGPYHRVSEAHDGIDLGIYCRASLAEFLDPEELLAITRAGFDFYHETFGYRYPFGKYDQCFVPEFNAGAMENAACVTILEDYVFRARTTDAAHERRAETILHEMAHMWFGDLVTMAWWDDLWLNESFASYISTLAQASVTRWREAWTTFAYVEKNWAYRQDQLPSTHPISADIPDVQAVEVNFDGITYAKGASVLKQLAAYVGVDRFFAAMTGYFLEHEYSNTTLADLLLALENASGRNLSGWSKQWLQTSGINTLRAVYEVDADGDFTDFTITQDAPGSANTLRDHRLAVGLYSGSPLRRVHRVELDVSGARTEVRELIGQRKPDLVVVNDDDLSYAKLRFDEQSLTTLTERIADLTDSLPRALAWTALWDMTRDAELPARRFVDLVLAGIAGEPRIPVVQALHTQLRHALADYADPVFAAAAWPRVAEKSLTAMRVAEPGSDHQLAWARMFALALRTDEQQDVCRRMLDGEIVVDGLAMDDELRWALLRGLVAVGGADDDRIAAEQRRDPTAAGARHAATARALRPSAAAKAAAWRLATEDDSLPNSTCAAVIAGFWHPAQTDLLTGYTERYFAMIDEVWERRTSELAQRAVTGLYPAVVAQSTVDAAERWLDGPDKPDALRRLVVEATAEVRRALRCREVDSRQPR